MKTKTFLDANEAVAYAHSCQQGGYDCALVAGRFSVIVCEVDKLPHVIVDDSPVEYFRFSKDASA